MRTVAVVGFSGTGKTRLIIELIGEFKKRGLRVCAVKRCSHGFAFDTEGKDTDDFGRAGADGVAMVSPDGWAALGQATDVEARALAARLFPGADVALIEGGKEVRGLRKVEVLRAGASEVLLSRPEELFAVVSDAPVSDGAGVPVFKPAETAKICELILGLEEDNMSEIKLEVDGREVNMNPFVRTFIERTVLGMVTSLGGVDPEPKKISLRIDRADAAAKPRRNP